MEVGLVENGVKQSLQDYLLGRGRGSTFIDMEQNPPESFEEGVLSQEHECLRGKDGDNFFLLCFDSEFAHGIGDLFIGSEAHQVQSGSIL